MPEQEEWRPIPGFPEYEVSSLGRIISHHPWRGRPGSREMRGCENGSGYRVVDLATDDHGRVRRYVHHLVAEAFHGPRPEGLEIRHLDGNSRNNEAANLLYGTASENHRDQRRHGTHPWVSEKHCRNGHERTAANTRSWPSSPGRRFCDDCRKRSNAAANARSAAVRRARRVA